ncbi:ubiquitin-related modifier 1 [Schizophyllum commune H4-8]|uniref:Ubiquitin-related modifier 1 n=1 Tax=Schizophyllum commune (strain H4-8 / FGSC 9210) TaxID=578458 RepID=D8Q7Q0_SCHCM|nr:ubiquitin-related modifier 1 [Schizophyllum commune H4-8]KAI5891391.1 ubiquitin-related modifier 1 [Schizophyllum commune H4-8]
MAAPATVTVDVEFSGGLELLFGNVRRHRVTLPASKPDSEGAAKSTPDSASSPTANASSSPADVEFLIDYLARNLLKERVELFVENGSVRPGILVLINNTDWELEGEGEYVLQPNDEIVFISTLHGG